MWTSVKLCGVDAGVFRSSCRSPVPRMPFLVRLSYRKNTRNLLGGFLHPSFPGSISSNHLIHGFEADPFESRIRLQVLTDSCSRLPGDEVGKPEDSLGNPHQESKLSCFRRETTVHPAFQPPGIRFQRKMHVLRRRPARVRLIRGSSSSGRVSRIKSRTNSGKSARHGRRLRPKSLLLILKSVRLDNGLESGCAGLPDGLHSNSERGKPDWRKR